MIIDYPSSLLCSCAGEKAVKECITQGRKFADASQGPDKGRVRKVCDDLDRLMGDLAEMRRLGKVNTLMFIFNILVIVRQLQHW